MQLAKAHVSLGVSLFSLLPMSAVASTSTGNTQASAKKSAENAKSKLLNAKFRTLKNGLRVVVVEDHNVPRVSVGVLYNVGSCDDPEDLFGLSHMTEHMFFHGSTKYPKIDVTIGNLGGSINAFTSQDLTMYTIDCPAKALPTVCCLEADRMGNFQLVKKELFNKEQMAVFEERLMCVENCPDGTAWEYIRSSLSPQHPYGREIIGLQSNIRRYSVDAVMSHYRKWYKPNNATLIVIGDANAEAVFAMAEQYFGWIKSGDVPERKRTPNALDKNVHHEITYYSDKLAASKVEIQYNVPHHSTHTLKEVYALNILLELLFGGSVYKFCRHFVDKKQMVSNISACADQMLNPCPLSIRVSLMPGIIPEKFAKEFSTRLLELVRRGVDPKEFARAKKSYLIDAKYKVRDGHSHMRFLLASLAMGQTIEQLEDSAEMIESITVDDVNAVLKSVFTCRPLALVTSLPIASKPKDASGC
jgi:zinc protease